MKIRNAKDLGALVREHRKRRNWTQTRLGEEIGASRAWVSAFEGGKPTAEIGLVLKALRVLGLGLGVEEPRDPAAKRPQIALSVRTGMEKVRPLGAPKRGEARAANVKGAATTPGDEQRKGSAARGPALSIRGRTLRGPPEGAR
jgi:HTH-type transcriptional regulator / antitoxin HipB